MKNTRLLNKTLILVIIILFIGSVFVPTLSGTKELKTPNENEFVDYIRYDDFEDYYVGEPPKLERGWLTNGVTQNQYIEARVDPLNSSNMVMLIRGSSANPDFSCSLRQEDFGPAGSYAIHFKIYTPQLSMSKTVYESIRENPYPDLVAIHRRTGQIRWGSESHCGDYYEFTPQIDPSTERWIEEETRVTKDELHLWHDNYVDALGGYCNYPIEGVNTWTIKGYRYATQDFYIDDFWITTYRGTPNKPIINGPVTGKPGVSYPYSFNSTDPVGNDVYYFIDWGDNKYEDWFGPFSSGVEVVKTHVFEYPGTYNIYAKAKDINEEESIWGMLTVTMPRDKATYDNLLSLRLVERFPLLGRLLILLN